MFQGPALYSWLTTDLQSTALSKADANSSSPSKAMPQIWKWLPRNLLRVFIVWRSSADSQADVAQQGRQNVASSYPGENGVVVQHKRHS